MLEAVLETIVRWTLGEARDEVVYKECLPLRGIPEVRLTRRYYQKKRSRAS